MNSTLAEKREKATLNKLGLKEIQSRRFTMKHTSGLTRPLAFVTQSLSSQLMVPLSPTQW